MRNDLPGRRPLAIGFAILGLASLAAQPFVEIHPHFPQETLFGFHAWIGIGSALLAFLLAWCVGRVTAEADEEDGDARRTWNP